MNYELAASKIFGISLNITVVCVRTQGLNSESPRASVLRYKACRILNRFDKGRRIGDQMIGGHYKHQRVFGKCERGKTNRRGRIAPAWFKQQVGIPQFRQLFATQRGVLLPRNNKNMIGGRKLSGTIVGLLQQRFFGEKAEERLWRFGCAERPEALSFASRQNDWIYVHL